MGLVNVLLFILVESCVNLEPKDIRFSCYNQANRESKVYQQFAPINYQMIPYQNWCYFTSCKYNKCKIIDYIPSCEGY